MALTAREQNALVEKSPSYFHSLKNRCPDAYEFYVEYGDGDIVKGYRDSRTRIEELKSDLYVVWDYYVTTEGVTLNDLLSSAVKIGKFANVGSAKGSIFRWITSAGGGNYHFMERKLEILELLMKENQELFNKIMEENK